MGCSDDNVMEPHSRPGRARNNRNDHSAHNVPDRGRWSSRLPKAGQLSVRRVFLQASRSSPVDADASAATASGCGAPNASVSVFIAPGALATFITSGTYKYSAVSATS